MNDYSEEYRNEHIGKDVSFEATLSDIRREYVLDTIRSYEFSSILEVGCGLNPIFTDLSGDLTKTHHVVVEPQAEFVKEAKTYDCAGNVEFVNAKLEDAITELGKFDIVIASSVLHEVPDPDALLQAISEVCYETTVVHLNVPNVFSFHRLLAVEMNLLDDVFEKSEKERKFDRHTHYDMDKLTADVERHGFEVLNSDTYLIKPFTVDQMEAIIKQDIVDESVVEGLKRMTKHLPEMGCEMYVEVSPCSRSRST